MNLFSYFPKLSCPPLPEINAIRYGEKKRKGTQKWLCVTGT